ncbi:MAG: hypothetical protein M3306_17425 [Actinomycetota bacterium]|nr:hypothetical protein [Actinomycetota bacterium]
MTNIPDDLDLAAIARQAQVEIEAAEAAQATDPTPDSAALAMDAELGYYEAELKNLRDAATTLDEAELKPE